MNTLDEILEQYDNSRNLTQEQISDIETEASHHLHEYLIGSGDVKHLYEYYDLMDKI